MRYVGMQHRRAAPGVYRRGAPKSCYHAARGNKENSISKVKLKMYSFPCAAWKCSTGALRQESIGAARLKPVTTRRVGTRKGNKEKIPAFVGRALSTILILYLREFNRL